MLILRLRFLMGFLCVLSITACTGDDDKKDEDNEIEFDQASFLKNEGEGVIAPSFQVFANISAELNASVDSFNLSVTQSNLDDLRSALKKTYLAWQEINFYDFGPAMSVSLKSTLNIYPTNVNQIENNIQNGNYNLGALVNKDAKGLPAVDYLIHATSDSLLLADFQSNRNRRNYLSDVASEISNLSNQANNEWQSSYLNTFKNASGTSVGSSTGLIINALNQHYERFFRDGKIGIPLGVRSSGIAKPTFTEAHYGGYSLELALANFQAMKNFYLGGSGVGLDDYLSQSNSSDLHERIMDQIARIEMKLTILNDPLSATIQTNSSQVQEAYNEIQKLIILWKVELPSRLGVLISYQDNDGD